VSPRSRLVALLALGGLFPCFSGCKRDPAPTAEKSFSVGDLHAVHTEVRVGSREVRGRVRVSDGDSVTTGPDGRARLRLDDGTRVVIGSATRFKLEGTRITLESGRLFLEGNAVSRTEVNLGAASTTVSKSSVALERSENGAKIYCAQGELVVSAAGKQQRVASGETASLVSGALVVAPEKAFNDWTGGLAVPFANESGKSAIAELRGRSEPTDPGAPLVVRSQKIDVRIEGEVAVTRARATYFNGLDRAVLPDVRLALPEGAILSRVARRRGQEKTDSDATLLIAPPADTSTADLGSPRLEWAGDGWLRGVLPSVESGSTLELVLEYSEWLSSRKGRASYRFPMASDGEPELVGELSARVDAERTGTTWIAASQGTVITDRSVELRKTDVRPTGDLVVELSPALAVPGTARAYLMQGSKGEDPFVMVRTEVPDQTRAGVTLAVVVDTSMSVGAATLETERAVLDAVLEGLGPRDALVVLAADQTVRPLGPATPRPVNEALRAEIRAALSAVRPGGASNLGSALERAADVLDAGERKGSGMLVYVGDGRPTVGDVDAEQIRRRLGQRATGVPRAFAVAVGPGADRWLLARLVAGAGSVYEVTDRAAAARAGAALLADALEPTLRDVELDLGPSIDRVYPREARAAHAGGTVSAVGRLRGKLPTQIGFRFRDGEKLVSESRPLRLIPTPPGADVPRRWAKARIEELAARGEGVEPGIALAAQTKLLTPWTSFFFEASGATRGVSSAFASRIQALSFVEDAPFAGYLDTSVRSGSTLLEPPRDFGGGVSLVEAAQAAIRRTLERAANAVRACRDARAAVRPDVPRHFFISVSVNAGGQATNVRVMLRDTPGGDPVLERCVKGVVEALPFFAAGATVNLEHVLTLPEGRSSKRTKCSPTSRLSLPIKKTVWRARAAFTADGYQAAAQSCELSSWLDRREYLLLMLERMTAGEALEQANLLDAAGETDGAAFVRKEALRRVRSFAELEELARRINENEPVIDGELEKAYKAASTDAQRLEVVRKFLRLSPHSSFARRRLFALLEALGENAALVAEIERARSDALADAGLLAQGASALKRLGHDAESRRAFGELIERAPGDPWTLAYVGDRLRAEGMFDEAVDAYENLARLLPNDAGVALRLALAHAASGRLDAASRLLERVEQTGGRGDDGRLGELASIAHAVLLSAARAGNQPANVQEELLRRLLATPLPDVASVIVVETPPSDDPVEVRVSRERGEKGEQSADFDGRALGLAAVRVERGDGAVRLRLGRTANLGPGRPARVRVAALLVSADRSASRLVTRELEVPMTGKFVELSWNGEALL
jgi:tetratricopeptide (TPR) repeat protein